MFIIIEYYSLSTTGTNTDNGAGTGTTVNNDTNENAKFNLRHEIDQHKNEKQNNSKKLIGVWTDGSSENASFDVRKDNIYYVEQFATYRYSFNGDTVKIFYPDWTFTGAVSFSKDTLLIISENGTTKYWKFAY